MGTFVNRSDVARTIRKFAAIGAKTELLVHGALGGIGEDLLGKSLEVVPYDQGDLSDAGYIKLSKEVEGPTLEVGYKANAENSIEKITVNHEDLTRNHPGGKQAKFLEKPWMAGKGRYIEVVKNDGRKALRG